MIRRWLTVSQYAEKANITENAARKRLNKATWQGLLERKLVLRGRRWVFAWREQDLRFPRHDGSER